MFKRLYSTEAKKVTGHGALYSKTFPAMIPVFLLGSAVFLGLTLTQSKIAHEKYLQQAQVRIQALEAEVDALQHQREQQLSDNSSTTTTSVSNNKSEHVKSSRWPWSR